MWERRDKEEKRWGGQKMKGVKGENKKGEDNERVGKMRGNSSTMLETIAIVVFLVIILG